MSRLDQFFTRLSSGCTQRNLGGQHAPFLPRLFTVPEKAGALSFLLMYSPCIYYTMQPSPEAGHISQTLQANFDRMLYHALEKYHSCPGFTLLVGSLLQYRHVNHHCQSWRYPLGLFASLYLVRQQGEGNILDDMAFSAIQQPSYLEVSGARHFLPYFKTLLESPERSGIYALDQWRYVAAAKECLQLCLCNRRKFSKRATQFACRDKVFLRNKPWAWKARLGVYSSVRKSRRYLQVRQWESIPICQHASFPANSPEDQYYRILSYKWRLDLLPVFLEKSAISSELADMLRTRTFTTMAQRFPRRMRLVREAIAAYSLRVEQSAVGGQ